MEVRSDKPPDSETMTVADRIEEIKGDIDRCDPLQQLPGQRERRSKLEAELAKLRSRKRTALWLKGDECSEST